MKVVIDKKAIKEINSLGKDSANRIYKFLSELEHCDPRSKGKALKGKLKELWRYRVGSYRILSEIQDEVLVVLVVRVNHRSKIY